jgi:hypothetical protein
MAHLRASGKGFAAVNLVAAVPSQGPTIIGLDCFYDKLGAEIDSCAAGGNDQMKTNHRSAFS